MRGSHVRPKTGPGPVDPELSPHPMIWSRGTIEEAIDEVLPHVRPKKVNITIDQSKKLATVFGVPDEAPELVGFPPEQALKTLALRGNPSKKKCWAIIRAMHILFLAPAARAMQDVFDGRRIFRPVRRWKKRGKGSYEVIR